jgi:hypothetical protein
LTVFLQLSDPVDGLLRLQLEVRRQVFQEDDLRELEEKLLESD